MVVKTLPVQALAILAAFVACLWPSAALAEDGYDLWLRYRPVSAAAQATYIDNALTIVPGAETPTLAAARSELQRGLNGLIGMPIGTAARRLDGAIVIGTPKSSPII